MKGAAMTVETGQVGGRVLPADGLRDRVIMEIRRRWIRATPGRRDYRVPADRVDGLARAALDAMLVRDFRITPRPSDDEYAQLLTRTRHWVHRGKPIRIMLGYAPMKNPKSVGHTHADWAEFFALCHLCAWHNKVCAVYPPGLRIKIIFDNSTVRMANRYGRAPMHDYMRSVSQLIPAMGYQSFIVGTMRQSSFAWLFHFGLYPWARRRVRRWEQDPANRETLTRMLEFSRRNLVLPAGLSAEQAECQHRDAARRYRVYWEALQLSGFSRMGNKLVAMYLDGFQHHIRQLGVFHLRSVGKQQGTQPWQGEGAMLDNGVGKLVPIVLTAKRRQELRCGDVHLSSILPMAGFDSMVVSRNPVSTGGGLANSILDRRGEN